MGSTGSASAAIYCRISKDREGAGLGVQRQEQDCRELAASLGWTVTQVFTDNDISAYSGKRRPEYESLLEHMRAGRINGVLTWHTDRLHRSPRELESYIDASEKHGVVTQTVKAGEIDLSTPSGRAVARTLGAWARYESEHKSDRITRKKLQLAQDGAFSGGPVPFGWRIIDGVPVIQETEAAEIRNAVRGFLAGRSIGFIVKDLNSRGIPTRRGQKWTSTAVRNMLMRPTNAGLSAYRGDIVGPSVFPAIITEDEWRAASSTLKNPSRLTQNGNKVRHLLAGLMLCGKCGSAMQTSSRSSKQGSVHYYKCKTTGGGHAFQTAAPVEEYVAGLVVAILSHPENAEGLTVRREADDAAELRQKAVTLRARLDEAANSFADGDITAKQMGIITAKVNKDLEVVEQQLATLRTGNILAGRSGSPEAVQSWWDGAGIEDRRAVIDALMTIYVDPVGTSAPRKFDPTRIRAVPKGQD
ncbi:MULTISPECIES: recombinase family protein [unclassified Arthrobacter]|uniref:recombinase family protein n=1 Tax=unclassified Arthrobacter TaxID=235627 RepID=UPI001C8638FA|nr:recombinase family protein [Arthrobacter sp. MAHUQ-56]MBX7445450.1 recombinase family protein [Arthrobacter sp. MAHUQ-56]